VVVVVMVVAVAVIVVAAAAVLVIQSKYNYVVLLTFRSFSVLTGRFDRHTK
jgi:hypothetical protein